ncbi:MAG TPA: hypothetical protein VK452_11175 [Dissulfurispiraceae bacterium]|nr:hypothetical protein [Dissulfurispiraceae bacterium]
MTALGSTQYLTTNSLIMAQTGMPAQCTDCHLGDSSTIEKQKAHEGLLTVKAIQDRTWTGVSRSMMKGSELDMWRSLEPRGNNRADALMPKLSYNGILKNNPEYKLIIWHDRNIETLAFNPVLTEQTCGQCHEGIVSSFLKSPMGGGKGAHTQSQYVTWTGPTGPQSCGLWSGKLAGRDQAAFSSENMELYNRHSSMKLDEKMAFDNQRRCNQCHVGCLDCHYSPQNRDQNDPRKGLHSFFKKPDPVSCYGGGKSFNCHAGPLERRRGDGYIRAEFTQSSKEGKRILNGLPDIHMQKGIYCVDCHEPNLKSGIHADLQRQVDCSKCHAGIVAEHAKGMHRKVDCASCHTALIGGYAFNFWSAVGPKGKENPLTRIQDYLVGAIPPLIIKNPIGLWIPVHVVPHTSGNVKADEVTLSNKLLFRNTPDVVIDRLYFSNDAYAITGLVRNLDYRDHDTIAWLNVDRVAHATGKSRSCGSCHDSTAQTIKTSYSEGSYKDVGAGTYTIVADEKGLRIVFLPGTEAEPLPKGLNRLSDMWALKGDFSLPRVAARKQFEEIESAYRKGAFKH